MDSEKKLKKCASCGNEFDVAFAFCPKCGSKYVEEKTLRKCTSCGTEFDSAFDFCPNCGTKYEPVGDNPAESQNTEQETVEAENSEAESASEENLTSNENVEPSAQKDEKPAKKGKKLRLILILFGILAVLGGGIAFFMVQQQNHLKEIELQRQQHEQERFEAEQRERELEEKIRKEQLEQAAAAEKARVERERLEAELEQKRYEEELLAQEKANAKRVLVNEASYISNQEGLYWSFTVPYYSEGIKIDCSTSAEFSWKMIFAVVPSYEDAVNFCNGGRYSYIRGSYKQKAQGYSIDLKGLQQGKTYYFCAFNDTMGFTAAKQYKIVPKITSY